MLSLLVTLFEVATDVGSTVVVTSAVEDFNVVENSVVCSVLGIDVCLSVVVMPGVETLLVEIAAVFGCTEVAGVVRSKVDDSTVVLP